jgi:5'-3' exonuclease
MDLVLHIENIPEKLEIYIMSYQIMLLVLYMYKTGWSWIYICHFTPNLRTIM